MESSLQEPKLEALSGFEARVWDSPALTVLPALSTGSGGSYKANTKAYKYPQHTSAPTKAPPSLERRKGTFGWEEVRCTGAWHRNKKKKW